ncbi:MAG: hypothetical protein LBV36_04225 [Chromatiales bacterium]|nr:hypothetical protein [Chromatiales bacterium]
MMEHPVFLIVNAGSSSVRLALFQRNEKGLVYLALERHEQIVPDTEFLRALLTRVKVKPTLVAHRFVHGGKLSQSARIDHAVRAELERCAPLAPLHNPVALSWLDAALALQTPALPQVAVLDTSFYAELPERATTYGLPQSITREYGLRRYGFHGIAHEAMWRAWCELRPDLPRGGRLISVQLGSGCSVTATLEGQAIDTSMGYTPTEGLMMATRSGDIDAGLIIYLQREGITLDALEQMLTRTGGLAGISGISGDFRVLLASDDAAARLAVEVFCYRVRKYIGAYIASLGGLDGIVFGGGTGEHQPRIRQGILNGLDELGISLDAGRNEHAVGIAARISSDGSRVDVRVQPVDEARVMAQAALEIYNARDI